MTEGRDMDRYAMLLHHRKSRLAQGDPIAPPLVSAATFHVPDHTNGGYSYSRAANPTWDELEGQLSLLEDAPVVAFPSGMAAISAALMAVLRAGQRVVLPSDGYYTTRLFAEEFLKSFGVTATYLPTVDFTTADFTGAAVVFIETPSNPGLDVCDIAAVVARAHAAGAVVIADNTTMTPVLQRPLDLGVDIVVAADTKAPSGHSDLLFGHVASRNEAVLDRVRNWRRLSGAVPGAFEAWLVHRGVETLEVRMARMCASAGVIAERLAAHPGVRQVRYPGLPGDPSHAIAKRQMAGFGFLISFTLQDADVAEKFLAGCPFIAQSTSFGATHTSAERRARWGDMVPEGFIRMSVGIEPTEPLWDAIAAALPGN
jgi:cystathionine gamma-lyase